MKRHIFDTEGSAHFVTFSCYKRRRLLDDDQAKGIVVHYLAQQLTNQNGCCIGFVVMPEHVHAMVWFDQVEMLSIFMCQWKRRSSMALKDLLARRLVHYSRQFDPTDPIWQPHYYDFNVYTEAKKYEKLSYMHWNPVRKGLVESPQQWRYGSARSYLEGRSVGAPIIMPEEFRRREVEQE